MSISFDATVTHDFENAAGREWLEANGLGGWASGTIAGCHTRRYHGLLVAATRPPVGRMVLLSKLSETLMLGDERFELDTNSYAGAVDPRGYELLTSFALDPMPTFVYEAGASPEAMAKSARLMLHASQLTFTHPVTGEVLDLHCIVPF